MPLLLLQKLLQAAVQTQVIGLHHVALRWQHGVVCQEDQPCCAVHVYARWRRCVRRPASRAADPQAWAAAEGYGVARNESIGLELLLEAFDVGHWRAPLQVGPQARLGFLAGPQLS